MSNNSAMIATPPSPATNTPLTSSNPSAPLGEANALKAIGDVQQFRKETNAALASYQHALDLFKSVGERLGEANALKAIGDVQQFRKETQRRPRQLPARP